MDKKNISNLIHDLLEKYNGLSLPVKAGIWFFIGNVVQKGIGFITTPIFTRIMPMDEYGIYSVYQSWRDILSIFITLGLASSVYMKKIVELDSPKEKDKLTASLQGLATLTTVIGLVIYLVMKDYVNGFTKLSTPLMLSIFVSVLLSTAFDFWATRERIQYRYKAMIMVTLIIALIKPVLAIVMMLNISKTAYVRAMVVVGVEIAVYSYMYYSNFSSGEKIYNKEYWSYAIRFVLPLIPHFLSQRILSQSDRIMINNMIGSGEAAIYSLANSVGLLLSIVVVSCDNVVAPWVYTSIKEKKYDQLKTAPIYILLMMAVLSICLITVSPELIRFFGPKEYYAAVWTLPPLTISVFFMMMYLFFIYFEYYFENTRLIMVATMTSALLNIVLNLIFIKLFGYIAAGYTTMICYAAYTIFHYLVYRRTCFINGINDMPYNVKMFLIMSAALIVVGLGMMFLYPYPVIRYSIVVIVGIAVIIKRNTLISLFRSIKEKKN